MLVHALPALALMTMVSRLILVSGNFHDDIIKLTHNSYYFIKIQFIIYNIVTLYWIYRYREQIKSLTSSNENHKLNWLFLITYGIMLTSLTDFILFLIPGFTDRGWGYPVFFIFINIFFFKAIIQPDQFLGIDEKKLRPVNVSIGRNKSFFEKIEEVINGKKLYLDPDLNLHNVAEATGIPDRVASQVIRQNTSMNFCDYINLKRLKYAKEILINTTKAEKNVLEVLYEAGFNSKSVFNTQFKKHTGMSPTEYREKFYKC
jgi:AraC-like DNA-binding protein